MLLSIRLLDHAARRIKRLGCSRVCHKRYGEGTGPFEANSLLLLLLPPLVQSLSGPVGTARRWRGPATRILPPPPQPGSPPAAPRMLLRRAQTAWAN